jgi:hypothetical protein
MISILAFIFNVSSDVLMELPFGVKISVDFVAVLPTGILAYFFYKEYQKRKE